MQGRRNREHRTSVTTPQEEYLFSLSFYSTLSLKVVICGSLTPIAPLVQNPLPCDSQYDTSAKKGMGGA